MSPRAPRPGAEAGTPGADDAGYHDDDDDFAYDGEAGDGDDDGESGGEWDAEAEPALIASHAEMLGNRLRKRARHLRKWARRRGVSCYRLYDRDIPEIALAIDLYGERVHIASYRRRRDYGPAWRAAMAQATADALGVERELVYLKERRRQRGSAQYERLERSRERFAVREGACELWVNLRDYLDTGLFLDHRDTRARVAAEAEGTRFLNLFCYTGAFTVHAAAAGARQSVSVDLSHTYLDWTRDNLELNGLDTDAHRQVREDVFTYLHGERLAFDLAVLDPPTFSNSKKMRDVLDIQRDHVELIARTLDLLVPGGVLYFSTGYRRFKLEREALRGARRIDDITAETTPEDFRGHRPHQCWRLVRR
ncbi:class I SAM-dependent methyltransferase [Haliangium ochraceum]|uniref:Oxidoreductase n=1 Tax=Haliangium ochraceum (strain DSM 14365 / JCM 11303 / SMP-2) TaxID=502025 RepID=D0LH66_HALO1|nr:class I SAM-dependent methyltransferase [Haliangium ochraceum]ACY18211.1 oxidoreductase [Haliangium ochraceum DSM 14365]